MGAAGPQLEVMLGVLYGTASKRFPLLGSTDYLLLLVLITCMVWCFSGLLVWCFSGRFLARCGVSAGPKPMLINKSVVFQRAFLTRCGVSAWKTLPIHRGYAQERSLDYPLANTAFGAMEGAQPRTSRAPVVEITSSSGQHSLSLAISRRTSFRKFCTVILSAARNGSEPN